MTDFKKFTTDDWALYLAKVCDLTFDTMVEIKKRLDNGDIEDILKEYKGKLDEKAVKLFEQAFCKVCVFTYYEIKNSTDERSSTVTGRYATEEIALEALKDKCDWYRPLGTGTIYKVNLRTKSDGTIEMSREEIYRNA